MAIKRIALDKIDREIAEAHAELGAMLKQPSRATEYKLQEFKGMLELRDRLRGY